MGHFAYTGVDAKGRTQRGTVDADDVKGVRQLLRKQGVFLDSATPLAEGNAKAKATVKAATNGAATAAKQHASRQTATGKSRRRGME